MASEGDRSETTPSSLPRPELNPLLNPLLADNMGRWAEVYFTSPPERREEAVLDLLRELGAENPQPHGASSAALQEKPHHPDPAFSATPFSQAEPVRRMRCQCGHDNPATHQFCGMCGNRLECEDVSVPDAPSPDLGSGPEVRVSPHMGQAHADDLSLFRSLSAHTFADDNDHEAAPSRSYRLYIGAGLALVTLGLGYMAWSIGHTQSSREAPPATTAAESGTPTSSPSSGAQPGTPKAAEQFGTPAKKALAASARPTEVPSNPPVTKAPEGQGGDTSETLAPAANGTVELAIAQHYLAGMNGQPRDTAEAAKWLWKSIAKHNGEATLLLADLYLKGDGVSKSCDQARVLLDSAARRGMSAAGERLRNLQAFGCQ